MHGKENYYIAKFVLTFDWFVKVNSILTNTDRKKKCCQTIFHQFRLVSYRIRLFVKKKKTLLHNYLNFLSIFEYFRTAKWKVNIFCSWNSWIELDRYLIHLGINFWTRHGSISCSTICLDYSVTCFPLFSLQKRGGSSLQRI